MRRQESRAEEEGKEGGGSPARRLPSWAPLRPSPPTTNACTRHARLVSLLPSPPSHLECTTNNKERKDKGKQSRRPREGGGGVRLACSPVAKLDPAVCPSHSTTNACTRRTLPCSSLSFTPPPSSATNNKESNGEERRGKEELRKQSRRAREGGGGVGSPDRRSPSFG